MNGRLQATQTAPAQELYHQKPSPSKTRSRHRHQQGGDKRCIAYSTCTRLYQQQHVHHRNLVLAIGTVATRQQHLHRSCITNNTFETRSRHSRWRRRNIANSTRVFRKLRTQGGDRRCIANTAQAVSPKTRAPSKSGSRHRPGGDRRNIARTGAVSPKTVAPSKTRRTQGGDRRCIANNTCTGAVSPTTRAPSKSRSRHRHRTQGGDRRNKQHPHRSCITKNRRTVENSGLKVATGAASPTTPAQELYHQQHVHHRNLVLAIGTGLYHHPHRSCKTVAPSKTRRTQGGDRRCIANNTCTGAVSPTTRAPSKSRSRHRHQTQGGDRRNIANSTRTGAVSPKTVAPGRTQGGDRRNIANKHPHRSCIT